MYAGGIAMPMLWRRITWFTSFAVALLLALSLRGLGYSWPATLSLAAAIWVGLPIVISQLSAAFILARTQSRLDRLGGAKGIDALVDKIGEATKGLPPDQQEAVAKRIIDEEYNR